MPGDFELGRDQVSAGDPLGELSVVGVERYAGTHRVAFAINAHQLQLQPMILRGRFVEQQGRRGTQVGDHDVVLAILIDVQPGKPATEMFTAPIT